MSVRARACRPSLSGEASRAHTIRAPRLVPRARARHANRYFVAYSKTRARTLPIRQADFLKTADVANGENRVRSMHETAFCYVFGRILLFFFFFL